MKCPSCGREVSDRGGHCSTCKALKPAPVATSALTPVPGAEDETVFMRGSTPHDEAATVFEAPPPPRSQAPDTTGLPASAGGGRKEPRGPLDNGQQFGSRYHILRQLGIGGMGAVYQAYDQELEVAVALKVIRPEVTQNATAAQDIERRFKQELLLARQVTHKNVVRIHDLGEIDGIKYITMPYIKGADLASVLRNERLPVSKVMALAREIAAGMQAAHEAGVVHRDLKPANVMIEGDHAIIMDFGIARSTSRVGSMPSVSTVAPGALDQAIAEDVTRYAATIAGEVVGTIEYMAPEQARGEHIDQRADIYAFGLMIYDMLTGRRRSEHAVSAVGELQRRLAQPPPPVRSVVPEVPQALEQVLTRCTEPDAAKRYQTTAELVEAIERLDDSGKVRPKKRVVRLPLAVAVGVALLTLSGYIYWATRPPVTHDPVTLVIADFVNNTGDAAFDRTLEPMLRRGLDEAGFITAYDRSRIRTTFGVQPPDKLDDTTTRELALKQGVGVVLAGSIDRRDNGYEIAIKAIKTVTGEVVADTRRRASNKDQVPETATRLVTTVRRALGDETSDSAQLLAMRSLSTTSMEVAANYAAAIAAQSNGQFEEARQRYQKTVELEANFGLGYQGLAIMSRNLGRLQDAQKYSLEALNHLEGMTGRERLAVRASYYLNTGDYQQCAKGYGELIAQYPADAVAHSNRAGCLSKLRNMREAVEGGRQAVQILPKRATLRANLAMLASYAGEFQTTETEAKKLENPTDMATLAVAFAQLGQGLLTEATTTYQTLGTIAGRGPSWMASGMGDLAVYEGRFSDAAGIFEQGAAADLAAKNVDRAGRKLTSMAYAHLMRGDKGQAVAAAEKALLTSNAVTIRFLAARVLVEAGVVSKAKDIADSFSAELPAEPQAYGKILEGQIALKNGDARQAIKVLTDATNILDTWLAHFDLGRAYLELRAFPQAELEFERCISRRGEALSLLVDEEPTFGHFPIVYYYQGRARDGLKNAAAAASYGEYLKIRGNSTEDPLLPEVRKRAGS